MHTYNYYITYERFFDMYLGLHCIYYIYR